MLILPPASFLNSIPERKAMEPARAPRTPPDVQPTTANETRDIDHRQSLTEVSPTTPSPRAKEGRDASPSPGEVPAAVPGEGKPKLHQLMGPPAQRALALVKAYRERSSGSAGSGQDESDEEKVCMNATSNCSSVD